MEPGVGLWDSGAKKYTKGALLMRDSEFVRRLRDEVGHWHDDGLVDAALAERLLARYDGQDGPARSRIAVVLAFLGALLIGIGVIAFVASNWSDIPGATKLGGIIILTGLSYHLGYRLRYVGTAYPGTGNALLFLGVLLYGASVFLVAQGAHVNAEAPSLLVLWAVGAIPMAYLLESRPLLTLGLLLLTLALGWETAFWMESIGGFCTVFLFWGVLLIALGRRTGRLAEPYTSWGLFVLLTTLTVLADAGVKEFGPTVVLVPGGQWRLVLLGTITLVLVLWQLVGAWRESRERAEAVGLLGLALVAAGVLGLVRIDEALVRTGFNLLLLAVLVGVLWLGYERREPWWVQLALWFFALEVVSRYVEFLWQAIPMELFFVGAGIVLLGGGIALERVRRTLLRRLAHEEITP